MAMIRCGYCGKYYDDGYTGALDNGWPPCPGCVAYEEAAEKEKAEKERENQQTQEKKGRETV